jgi:hypothetical protein
MAWNCDDDWRWADYSSIWAQFYTYMVTTYRSIYEENKNKYSNLILSQWGCTGISEGIQIGKDINFSFIGGFHGKRKQYNNYLKKKTGIISYGNGAPPIGIIDNFKKGISQIIRIPWNPPNTIILDQIDVNNIWNRSKISFTPLESGNGDKLQIKARIFDMGLSGTLMICSKNPLIDEFYDEDIEYISYEEIHECAEKVKFYLKNENARNSISNSYYLRTKKEHMWHSRFSKIFNEIGLKSNMGK